MHYQLDRIHVMGDHHQLSLLLFDQCSDRVEALPDDGRAFARRVIFSIDLLLGLGQTTYFGHLTKRVKSRLGWISWPMPKFLGLFSKRGFTGFFSPFFWPGMGGGAT